VITLDIYDLRSLPRCTALMRLAGREKKAVYIEGTWRSPFFEPQPGATLEAISVKSVGDAAFEELDGKWIRALAAWASAQRWDGITPIWMQTFFAYGGDATEAFDPGYLRNVMTAIAEGKRTKTYSALQRVSAESAGK
jgi:hypothetical protein